MKPNRFERLEKYLVRLIRSPEHAPGRSRPAVFLLACLKHLSFIYRGAVGLRHWLYDHGLFRHHALGCQVISIGNLTVGGTGKTPVVEIFARELRKEGRKVAVLSRGYKKAEPGLIRKTIDAFTLAERRRPPRVVSDGTKLLLDSAMSGDEPYMLASNLPEVAVLVDKDRVKSGRYAIDRLGCDTLMLDDGFQYRALKHWVEIVLVDKTDPFGNEHVLPRGILREPVKNIMRADFVFITKSDGKNCDRLKERIKGLNPGAEIIECRHCPRHLQGVFSSERRELGALRGMKVMVLSGIADPGGFERELASLGSVVVGSRRFADHHRYSQQEIIDLVNESIRIGAEAIITTEKDAVRFPRLDRCDIAVLFLRVDIEILAGNEDFHQCIERICFRGRDAAGQAGAQGERAGQT